MEANQEKVSRYEREIAVSHAEVYRAFTVEGALRAWLCDIAEVDPRPGGRFYLREHFAAIRAALAASDANGGT